MNNPWKKHKIPPIDRIRWCANAQDFLDFELAIAPAISSENPNARIILYIATVSTLIRAGIS